MYAVKFNTSDTIDDDPEYKSKNSFYKQSSNGFNKSSYSRQPSEKFGNSEHNDTNAYFMDKEEQLKDRKVPKHQIDSGSQGNPLIVPKRGVTLIMNGNTVKKSHGTSVANNQVYDYKQNQTKPGMRMSRAQYAATIAVSHFLV